MFANRNRLNTSCGNLTEFFKIVFYLVRFPTKSCRIRLSRGRRYEISYEPFCPRLRDTPWNAFGRELTNWIRFIFKKKELSTTDQRGAEEPGGAGAAERAIDLYLRVVYTAFTTVRRDRTRLTRTERTGLYYAVRLRRVGKVVFPAV